MTRILNIYKTLFCIVVLSTIFTNHSYGAYTVDQVKDPIYEKMKKEGKYSFSNVFQQTNIYKKPSQNLPLPTATTTYTIDSRLVIPSIQMNLKIMNVDDIHKVSHGAWHVPDSSTPNLGGNTVIIGHRISLAGGVQKPWDFFYLPEVKVGDSIVLYWKGVKYNYTVIRTSVEDPNDSDIESPTTDNILTVYTCYPLWTTDYRFAIQARLNK